MGKFELLGLVAALDSMVGDLAEGAMNEDEVLELLADLRAAVEAL